MNQINLSELHSATTRERIEAYVEGIANGKAVLLTEAMDDIGGVRKTWKNVCGNRMIFRIVDGKKTALLVNATTAEKLAKEDS